MNAKGLPCGERWIPQHRWGFKTTTVDEAGRKLEIVLRSEADDLDFVVVLASKLLDIWRLTATRRSMRREEPEQHRSVAVNDITKRLNRPVSDSECFDIENVVR